jgi:chemotaxis protein CheD
LVAVAQDISVISVLMGELKSTTSPHRLRTILGSCVGIMLFDGRKKVGSLGHIVLPWSNNRVTPATVGKFADTALPAMIDQIQQMGGGPRLTAKLAGGAAMFGVGSQTNNIGLLNKQAVEALLKEAGIPIIGQDLGGEKGRRVTFDIATGEVTVEIQGQPTIQF